MEPAQNQRPATTSTPSRSFQFHPARGPILDLFNLYLGLGRNSRQKPEESLREPPNKTHKRVHALNRELPPPNEQFIIDFEQLQSQFPDQDQLRSVTETILISLVVQCSGHGPRADFLLFVLRSLWGIGCINWDSLLPSLLSSVSSAELPVGQLSQAVPTVSSSSLSQAGMLPPSSTIANSSNFQSSNPASPLTSVHTIGSPAQPTIEPLSCAAMSPVKSSDVSSTGQQSKLRGSPSGIDESDIIKSWRPDKAVIAWLHSCLDVIWLLRRDMMAMHMQMLDQHLHCPTFGTHRILTQTMPNVSGEAVANQRLSPITYLSVLGEPLHGEDIASSIQKGSLDWERAVRCIRHALRTTPSPDWWRRVLVLAPCYRSPSQVPTAGAVFSSEMICEATIDRIVELLKMTNSGNNLFSISLLYVHVLCELYCIIGFLLGFGDR
uniref:Mediator of RNA polymerase II transcription subunit 23 n=1 Tax=Cajanus cajan TaxID=3821 RepID=A0A151T8J8_CAJCA|nr:hypothetical protein KK1_017914 [Cajanus cajan]